MRKSKLLAVTAGFVILAAACGSDSEKPPADTPRTDETPSEALPAAEESLGGVPTKEDLVGIWLADESAGAGGPLFWQFTPDGTLLIVVSEGFGIKHTILGGPFELNGDNLVVTNTEGYGCDEGVSRPWRVSVSGDGRLRAVSQPGGQCTPGWKVRSFTQISPQSPAAEAIVTEVATTEVGETITSPGQAQGIWRREGTGQLLWIDDDGTYQLDDGGQIGIDPDDIGSVDVGDDGTLRFTSGPESRDCSEGDLMTWTDTKLLSATVDHEVVSDVAVLDTVVSEDACGDLADPLNWIRIVES